MKKIIITCLFLISASACTDGDQPPDNAEHLEQKGVGSTSSTNATANQELDTNTAFNTMSTESYHQAEDPLEKNSTREARGYNNSPATPQDTSHETRMSGSATTSAKENKEAQKMNDQIVQEIQSRIQSDKELSNLGRRVEAVKINEQILLTGAVRNEEEKQKIEKMARQLASEESVTSRIEILKK